MRGIPSTSRERQIDSSRCRNFPLPGHSRSERCRWCSSRASAYEALLHEAHARGRLTMVDPPNIRPAVISDPDAYRRRFRSWLPAIDILKVSDDDAKWLGSVDGAEWLHEGVGAVLLTRGGDGLRLITEQLDVSVPAPQSTSRTRSVPEIPYTEPVGLP